LSIIRMKAASSAMRTLGIEILGRDGFPELLAVSASTRPA
jgi:hypothetical protein